MPVVAPPIDERPARAPAASFAPIKRSRGWPTGIASRHPEQVENEPEPETGRDGEREAVAAVLPRVAAHYGQATPFAEGRTLLFPDFEMRYGGQDYDPLNGYRTWIFKIIDSAGEQVAQVYTGGAINEPTFACGGHTFSLRLVRGTQRSMLVVSHLNGEDASTPR